MDKEKFRSLMLSLYNNNQLFIPEHTDIESWINHAFDNTVVNVTSPNGDKDK